MFNVADIPDYRGVWGYDLNNGNFATSGWAGRISLLVLALAVFTPATTQAQDAGGNRADPGEVQRRIEQIQPRLQTEEPPSVPTPDQIGPSVRTAPDISFVLTAVTIQGATAFTPGQLAPLYTEYLARTVTQSDIEKIAERITQTYTDAGFFISRAVIPPQQIEVGILRVTVIEGFVERVRFLGAEQRSDFLARYASSITQDRPARLATVERSLLLINSLPGIRTTDVELTKLDEAGGYEIVIGTGFDRAEGLVNLDNRGTPEVGRLQGVTIGGINSLVAFGDKLKLAAATVPDDPKELQYGQLAYELPLGRDGINVGSSIALSHVNAGSDLARLDTESRGLNAKATVQYPLILARRETLYLRGAFEVHELKEDRLGQSTIDDSLRVVRLQADYAVQDDWQGTNFLVLEVSQGLDLLGASDNGDPRLSRSDGEGEFTKFRLNATRRQALWGPLAVVVASQAQLALQPLLSHEEVRLGGSQFGRAYDFGELTGEHALAGSIEVQYGEETGVDLVPRYEVYGFYDIGAVWNRNVPEPARRESLASAGAGIRLGLAHEINATVELAKPLTREVATTGDRNVRLFFTVTAQF